MLASFLVHNVEKGHLVSSPFYDVDNIDDKFMYLYNTFDEKTPVITIVPHNQVSKIIEYDEKHLHNSRKTLKSYKYGFLLKSKVTQSPYVHLRCPNCHSQFTTESMYEGFRTCRICGKDYRNPDAVTMYKYGNSGTKKTEYPYPDVEAIVKKYHDTLTPSPRKKKKSIAKKNTKNLNKGQFVGSYKKK